MGRIIILKEFTKCDYKNAITIYVYRLCLQRLNLILEIPICELLQYISAGSSCLPMITFVTAPPPFPSKDFPSSERVSGRAMPYLYPREEGFDREVQQLSP
ncbi:hypothetical protein KsCSTR_04560 [Candidatus Kuenenia stuttgartiensis]|jgi:hypothetical protein|uniref:Uncharacterized protein n=1 Tax=Kuenenia stuttgartiensis TaxID=174633 RepID=Q1Q0D1_KUEST|nr:hypothetical protein KsCSTR_04560 [Candidatus Kuenenia stuttgartiensis]CAJ72786.1 unknown protein [Candidatus Kuenenia stuttgartiensis]SOH04282.1 hypothetical protein KSMBR1_1783 [Candidatus Kuenenia stuttgartiensis]